MLESLSVAKDSAKSWANAPPSECPVMVSFVCEAIGEIKLDCVGGLLDSFSNF